MLKLADESYMHAAARHTVAEWLSQQEDPRDDACCFGPLAWRWQRRIYTEYPLVEKIGNLLWDETMPELGDCPSYQQLKAAKLYPDVILDVAIPHKGTIKCAVEIRHKHAVTKEKYLMLAQYNIEFIELSAEWILSQTRPPSNELINKNILSSNFTSPKRRMF